MLVCHSGSFNDTVRKFPLMAGRHAMIWSKTFRNKWLLIHPGCPLVNKNPYLEFTIPVSILIFCDWSSSWIESSIKLIWCQGIAQFILEKSNNLYFMIPSLLFLGHFLHLTFGIIGFLSENTSCREQS